MPRRELDSWIRRLVKSEYAGAAGQELGSQVLNRIGKNYVRATGELGTGWD